MRTFIESLGLDQPLEFNQELDNTQNGKKSGRMVSFHLYRVMRSTRSSSAGRRGSGGWHADHGACQ